MTNLPVSRFRLTSTRAALLSAAFVALWRGLVFAFPDHTVIEDAGWGGLYLIGLAWAVYLVERVARRIEAKRAVVDPLTRPLIPIGGEIPGGRRGGWNPFDPAAKFYGRNGQRLRQSLALLATYSLLFMLIYFLAHLQFATAGDEESELPAGGGNDSIKAQTVKVVKVIRKKYVVNPYSNILFAAPPPIDQIELKLDAETANQYKAGSGPGGLGQGQGKGGGFGSGTGLGKYELVRLEHYDKTWNKNYNIGGDYNLLLELKNREPLTQIAPESRSVTFAALARYSPKKPLPLLYVGGAHGFAPTASDKKILREYLVEKHGMILGDNLGGGGFHNGFIAAMNEVTGVTAVTIPRDDRIHQRPYDLPQLPIVVAHGGTAPLGWKIDGRWAVYYHPGAMSDAWRDDHAGIKKAIWEQCYQLGINILFYAYAEQDKWRQARQGTP